MTDVHYKIRYTSGDKRIDSYVTLQPVPFGSSRVEQVFYYCVDNLIDTNTATILETANKKDRISVLLAYQRWLKAKRL